MKKQCFHTSEPNTNYILETSTNNNQSPSFHLQIAFWHNLLNVVHDLMMTTNKLTTRSLWMSFSPISSNIGQCHCEDWNWGPNCIHPCRKTLGKSRRRRRTEHLHWVTNSKTSTVVSVSYHMVSVGHDWLSNETHCIHIVLSTSIDHIITLHVIVSSSQVSGSESCDESSSNWLRTPLTHFLGFRGPIAQSCSS